MFILSHSLCVQYEANEVCDIRIVSDFAHLMHSDNLLKATFIGCQHIADSAETAYISVCSESGDEFVLPIGSQSGEVAYCKQMEKFAQFFRRTKKLQITGVTHSSEVIEHKSIPIDVYTSERAYILAGMDTPGLEYATAEEAK